jgi:ATP-dependent RNA helicase HelY
VRGDTTVVVDEQRPVPLWQHMMVGKRLFDLFDYSSGGGPDDAGRGSLVNPELLRHITNRREADRLLDAAPRGRGRGSRPRLYRTPSRYDVVSVLDHSALLPAIVFVFSRAGCDAAVAQCLRSALRLTDDDERERIAEVIDRRTADLSDTDLMVLGYYEWREGLLRGVAAHHAGMLPIFRHTVEELFTAGLTKVVYATETLALGINMPARTVVLERLVKFNGEQHVPLTPGEYTQLTGRAGRRGIDVEGHAVVLWQPDVDPAEVAGLASTRTFPLRSSFAPSYNMTINLVHQMGPDQAHELLERSFAQYQADRSVVGLVRAISRNEQLMRQVAAELSNDAGEEQTAEALISYARLRAKLSERERAQARSSRLHRRQLANEALSSLRRGDIISITRGKRGGLAVVLEADRDSTDPRPLVLTENRWAGRISSADYSDGAAPLGSMTLPKRVEHRQPRVRRDMASALRSAAAGLTVQSRKGGRRNEPDVEPELRALRDELRHHPAHPIADREAKVRIAERYLRLEREIDQLRGKVAAATNSLARTFDRIVGLLTERRFIEERSQGALHVTDDGRLLARIYSESDLLVAECLRGGLWRNLGPAELASVVSAVVYETRGSDGPTPPLAAEIPTAPLRRALAETRRLSAVLRADEHRHRLNLSREPDEGFVTAVYRWVTTGDLAAALEASDVTGTGTPLPAGDFVRWCRQVVDMLDQIRNAATDNGLRNSAKRAIDDIRRGVVAVDGG